MNLMIFIKIQTHDFQIKLITVFMQQFLGQINRVASQHNHFGLQK
jgi:hypothetical protein